MNGMFQMIQHENSQAVTNKLSQIEESLQNVALKNNIFQEATSQKVIGPRK